MDHIQKFCDLPIEMQVEAVTHIEKVEDRLSLAGVNEHCRMLAADPYAWQGDTTLVMGTSVSGEDAAGLVRTFSPGVKAVEYTVSFGADFRVHLLTALMEEAIRLRKLNLIRLYDTSSKPRQLLPMMTKLVEYAASTQELESVMVGDGWEELLEFPSDSALKATSMKELTLAGCFYWSNIRKIMAAFPNLQLLYGDRILGRLPPKDRLEEDSKLLSKLKCFYLSVEYLKNLTDSDMGIILSSCEELQALAIKLTLRDGNSSSVADAISRMEKLVFLSLRGVLIRGVFKPGQPSFLFLQRLRLTGYVLGEEEVRRIAMNCPNLRWFAAHNCEMSDASIIWLLSKKLQILSLCYVRTLTGVPWMSQLPTRAPELQLIRLDTCGVPMKLAEQAAMDRPGLVVAYRDRDEEGPIDKVFRAVKVGENFRMEKLPASRFLRLSDMEETGPNLRAICEGQVVPKGIVEHLVKKVPLRSGVHVRCDLSCYFMDCAVE